VFAVFLAFVVLTLGKKDDKEDEKDECQICKDFVTSFNKVSSSLACPIFERVFLSRATLVRENVSLCVCLEFSLKQLDDFTAVIGSKTQLVRRKIFNLMSHH
jgi:hypothetical protein